MMNKKYAFTFRATNCTTRGRIITQQNNQQNNQQWPVGMQEGSTHAPGTGSSLKQALESSH